MKIQILAVIAFLFVTQGAVAAVKSIEPCNSAQMQTLQKSIDDQKGDGLSNTKLMRNTDKEVVGFYAWEKSGEPSMHAEICEYLGDDAYTIASEWFYWDGDADPSSFKKNKTYQMSQDEGIARLKVLKTSETGNITAALSIVGWNDQDTTVFRRSIVTFEEP